MRENSENLPEKAITWHELFFVLCGFACLLPFVAPPYALALGIFVALTIGNPFAGQTGKISKILLQISVVGLGFGMNIGAVLEAGKDGILFTVGTIFGTLAIGHFLGKLLKMNAKTSHLISSGTAICGGSAIAAVAPVIEADEKEISVSLAIIFILNSIALFTFPPIGHALGLTEKQFGIWAAIAIQDTSSVVGASAKYGAEALQTATTIKLARALWIIPLVFLTAWIYKSKTAKPAIPYFIFLFVAASVFRSYVPLDEEIYGFLVSVSKQGLTLTLFLIGAGLSLEAIRSVGVKPLIQGVSLWIVLSLVAFVAVRGL